MPDVILESVRALILLGIVIVLWNKGRGSFELTRKGWNYILAGFGLHFLGSLVDITDNFEGLNRFVIIGDTPTEAFLVSFVCFLGGFVLFAVGLLRWIPQELAERKRAQDFLVAAIEGMPEGFAYYDADDRLAVFNKKMAQNYPLISDVIQLGTTFEEVLRTGIERGQFVEARGREEEFYKENLAYHRDPGGAIEHNLPDGRWIQVEEKKTPEGGVVGIRTDITQRKQAENALLKTQEELQQALAKQQELNKLQRQFVSMASHEFRTPLAIIDATAQRMKSRAGKNQLTPADALQRVEKIRDAVKRMTRLMDSTLDAARMEEGKIKIEIKPCDIGKVVAEICAVQQEIAQTHVISCDLADLPETIQADIGSLEQVLTNLLSNAVKYAPDAPDIEVKAGTKGDQVVISVRDHGIGIDEDELGRIGERFFRARTSTGIAGTGIGLNLVKTLVEMLGGSISIDSKRGEGSTFSFRVPIAGPDLSQQADAKVA
jgi:signal transduction histidine kinase